MIRIDLSSRLIHLTRAVDGMTAGERLERIISEGFSQRKFARRSRWL